MDVSSEYVKMCEKAVEIQALAPKPTILGGNFWHYPEGATGAPIVWLPRQDQLQEMLRYYPKDRPSELIYGNLAIIFGDWCASLHNTYTKYLRLEAKMSMEQLWLAFVMKEKYNKVWNGADWIAAT